MQAIEAHKERRNNLKNSSSLLDGVLGQHHAPTALLQGKETPVSFQYETPFGPSGQENSLLSQNWSVGPLNEHSNSWRIKNQLDVTCYIYFTS